MLRAVRTFVLLAILLGMLLGALTLLFGMPGFSHSDALPPLLPAEQTTQRRLHGHVKVIAREPRHTRAVHGLNAAADYIEQSLRALGYAVQRHAYHVGGVEVFNLEVVLPATSTAAIDEVIVLGAHYDSTDDGSGANDNASGSAALLELARLLQADKNKPRPRTVRLVWFTNEEPPHFKGDNMGSVRYARLTNQRANEWVIGMLSLETMGYYRDEAGSQTYPHRLMKLFYPDAGNFIAFVANWRSRQLVRDSVAAFRRSTLFPSAGLALPDDSAALHHIADPLSYSDHWSFWQHNIPALMVTDTAFMRDPNYHTAEDTPDKIDYERLARVTHGLLAVVEALSAKDAEEK